MARAFIALGANLGDRLGQLRSAARALGEVGDGGDEIVARSSVWETAAIGPPPDYLNAVVALESSLSPRALLERLLRIEAAHGRRRGVDAAIGANAPRTLDLDLLLYDDQVLVEDGLELPHPRMHQRAFVLGPLCEIAADLRHPLLHCSMGELYAALPSGQVARRIADPL